MLFVYILANVAAAATAAPAPAAEAATAQPIHVVLVKRVIEAGLVYGCEHDKDKKCNDYDRMRSKTILAATTPQCVHFLLSSHLLLFHVTSKQQSLTLLLFLMLIIFASLLSSQLRVHHEATRQN
jgi:hypothetical protein